MKVYLAHAKTNYASELDGYVMGLREADHALTLWSFVFATTGSLPIHYENLHRRIDSNLVDEHGLRSQPPPRRR